MISDAPVYVSHKRVQALEIVSVGTYHPDRSGVLVRDVVLKGHEGENFEVSQALFVRYVPGPGDFLVRYADGYLSFSPRKAFLEGYALASDGNVLMERLSDLSHAGPGVAPLWLQGDDWVREIAKVAREAYVTINSLKSQLENLQREKANDL
jgi:hypothetical protein